MRDLLNAALKEDASTELLHQALTAAADTVNEQKVKALTRSLANGLLNDAAQVDQESLVVRALADLDSVHVKLLAVIAEQRRETEPWLLQEISMSREVFGPVVIVLERNGLVVNDTDFASQFDRELGDSADRSLADGATAWKVTGFGLVAMKRLDPDSA